MAKKIKAATAAAAKSAKKSSIKAKAKPTSRIAPEMTARDNSKQAQLIEMLKRPVGATITQIMDATGWQQHSVRGFLSGTLKKKLGLTITSVKEERGRIYRIAA